MFISFKSIHGFISHAVSVVTYQNQRAPIFYPRSSTPHDSCDDDEGPNANHQISGHWESGISQKTCIGMFDKQNPQANS